MDKQQQFDAKQQEYLKALYESPRDEHKCLALAKELLALAKGTRIEARQQQVVARHERKKEQ